MQPARVYFPIYCNDGGKVIDSNEVDCITGSLLGVDLTLSSMLPSAKVKLVSLSHP